MSDRQTSAWDARIHRWGVRPLWRARFGLGALQRTRAIHLRSTSDVLQAAAILSGRHPGLSDPQAPLGARSLGTSDRTAHQFFSYGDRSYGALFHMEVTEQIIADMTEVFADEVKQLGLDGAAIRAESQRHLKALHDNARIFYQQWAALCLQA